MNRPLVRRSSLVTLVAMNFAVSLAAQECDPGDSSNEAKTMAILSVPLAFSNGAAPTLPTRRVRLGLEAATIPNVPDDIATPTICRPGKGPEDTDRLPGLIRPRVALGLGHGLTLEASWIPPVTVNGMRANLFGFSAGWSSQLSPTLMIGVRGHTTLGDIKGPITCPEDQLDNPTSECFDGQESDDQFKPNLIGADASMALSLGGGRWRPYAGVGYTHSSPRFQVNFTNAIGQVDTTLVVAELDRVALFGGITWAPKDGWDISGEVYSTPADAVTIRVMGRATL